MNTHSFITALLCTLTGLLSASDVVMTAKEHGHTAFHDAVHAAGLYDHAQKAEGEEGSMAPFTVFVPTNKAFEKIASLDDKEKKGLITFHVAPGQKIASRADMPRDGIGTVGEELLNTDGTTIGLADSSVRAKIIGGPIQASNGVLYIIDTVLIPEGMDVPTQEPATPQATQHLTQVAPLHLPLHLLQLNCHKNRKNCLLQ